MVGWSGEAGCELEITNRIRSGLSVVVVVVVTSGGPQCVPGSGSVLEGNRRRLLLLLRKKEGLICALDKIREA